MDADPMRGDLAALLYIGDYFADTLHLCAPEHVILQHLLLQEWIQGPGVCDIDLAPAGLGLDEWQPVKATVLPLAQNARPRISGTLARLRAWSGKRLPAEDWAVIRRIVFERDGERCVYCGSTKEIQGDHVVPLCRGGSNALDNVVTACAACNLSKASRTVAEWQAGREPGEMIPPALVSPPQVTELKSSPEFTRLYPLPKPAALNRKWGGVKERGAIGVGRRIKKE